MNVSRLWLIGTVIFASIIGFGCSHKSSRGASTGSSDIGPIVAPIREIGPPGVATFRSPAGAAGETVDFYRWEFGDGSSIQTTAAEVQHVYVAEGDYIVTVVLHYRSGAVSAEATIGVTVDFTPPTLLFESIEIVGELSEEGRVSVSGVDDTKDPRTGFDRQFDLDGGAGLGSLPVDQGSGGVTEIEWTVDMTDASGNTGAELWSLRFE